MEMSRTAPCSRRGGMELVHKLDTCSLSEFKFKFKFKLSVVYVVT